MTYNVQCLGIALLITMGSACEFDKMDGEGGTGSSTATGDDGGTGGGETGGGTGGGETGGGTGGGETGGGTGECEQYLPDEPGQAVTFELHNQRDQPIYLDAAECELGFHLEGPDSDLFWPRVCEYRCEDILTEDGCVEACDCFPGSMAVAPGGTLTHEFSGNLFEWTQLPQACMSDPESCSKDSCVAERQAPSGDYELSASVYRACDPGDRDAGVCNCDPSDGTCPLYPVGDLSDKVTVSQILTYPGTEKVVLTVE